MRRVSSSVKRTRCRRAALGAAATAGILAVAVPTLSWGHAVVFPRQSTTGGYEKYVLRVPNEKAVATTRVEIHFPAGLRVTSFADLPGLGAPGRDGFGEDDHRGHWHREFPPIALRRVSIRRGKSEDGHEARVAGLSDLRRRRTGRMDRARRLEGPASVTTIGARRRRRAAVPDSFAGCRGGPLPVRSRASGSRCESPRLETRRETRAPNDDVPGCAQRTTIAPSDVRMKTQ